MAEPEGCDMLSVNLNFWNLTFDFISLAYSAVVNGIYISPLQHSNSDFGNDHYFCTADQTYLLQGWRTRVHHVHGYTIQCYKSR